MSSKGIYAVLVGPANRPISNGTVWQPTRVDQPADHLTREQADLMFSRAVAARRDEVTDGITRVSVVAR